MPLVSWISPVRTEETYEIRHEPELLRLEAEAVDDTAVERVIFYRWDSQKNQFTEIGADFAAPYDVEIQASSLNFGWNQVFAEAYDQAANRSKEEFIWVYREGKVYLPNIANILAGG